MPKNAKKFDSHTGVLVEVNQKYNKQLLNSYFCYITAKMVQHEV